MEGVERKIVIYKGEKFLNFALICALKGFIISIAKRVFVRNGKKNIKIGCEL